MTIYKSEAIGSIPWIVQLESVRLPKCWIRVYSLNSNLLELDSVAYWLKWGVSPNSSIWIEAWCIINDMILGVDLLQ